MNTNNHFDQENLKNQSDPSKFTQFLWWCAGANLCITQQYQKQNRVKYTVIGFIILLTSLLTALSGFLLLNIYFEIIRDSELRHLHSTSYLNISLSILFGTVLGFLIFKLNRHMVSHIGIGDGTVSITLKEYKKNMPFLLISFILGFVLSIPLQIQILKPEIKQVLHNRQEDSIVAMNRVTISKLKQKRTEFEKDKSIDKGKLSVYEKQLADYDSVISEITQQKRDEMENGKTYGYGPAANKLQKNVDQKKKEKDAFIARNKVDLESIIENIANIDKELANHLSAAQTSLRNNELKAKNMDGIIIRASIAHEKNGQLCMLLTIAFIQLLCSPIVIKMLIKK